MTYSDSEDEELNDELRRYNEYVAESDGFDVPDFVPKGSFIGGIIRRLDLSHPHELENIIICAKFAIKHYNHLPENNEKKLKLVKVVKATGNYPNYYITLKARDDSGFVSLYETAVFRMLHDNKRSVSLFRPKRKTISKS
ncbi:uncharacterized protein LOC126683044 [Mercurialis annua]|uniref:uncharacterized protein LOC126683044 n=1 Tax=Mercurialis annua TaxID=3986 RepID=UPI00215F1457|nr:uncharacterized protein LOC126683044 [Mercurialis annua]